ncbi:D-glycerate 3-kinase-like protein [Massarina eburnea CBS 473.64]|uniref:D-glycerate 3-kinase-like protein n=1 Tax=Massarina eburnea CBS 473.64 TaxID=1395130 RepID=A0A6A6S5N8_9PLEO|nr:D-glycerate 3-kinase-like protein [Massarina eburnea CBS 473.64]
MSSLESNIRRALDILIPKIQALHKASSRPIILGITGLQGSGKSTWASLIVGLLASEYSLSAITVSLDDFYKTHDGLVARREQDAENKIYRTRGQPGTHDEQLAAQFFKELAEFKGDSELRIPSFDKSMFNGEGDRAPKDIWHGMKKKPDVVVFEGWCVGFQPLARSDVEEKHKLAIAGKLPVNTPAQHKLEHLLEVNESLERYCEAFMGPQHFDFMIHIDTNDLKNVYKWRLEQEHKLIAAKGTGMKDEEVKAFIDGYMPGYELYLEKLREGFFQEQGRQVRVVLDADRAADKVEEL